MDINKVLLEYDNMFGMNSLEDIDDFLTSKIEEALEEKDYYSALTLMNEMLGFCRDTSQHEKGLHYCELVEKMFDKLGLTDTVDYATSLINVASAYRAFGRYEKAMDAFRTVEIIYRAKLPVGEFNFASLYNNWSLLYQEMGDFRRAEQMLKRALSVIDTQANAAIQQATTRCNLAVTLLRVSQEAEDSEEAEQAYDEAMKYLRESLAIFEKDGGRDFHYGAALSAMGDAMYIKERYDEAAEYYARTMKEIEKHTGKTDAYARVEDNYRRACEKSREQKEKSCAEQEQGGFEYKGTDAEQNKTDNSPKKIGNIDRCKAFYEKYGAPMIHARFPQYEQRIAVGLVGEGSDCFGFDDAISKDHDYGLGFCMWLTTEDYERIGITLNKAYEQLLQEHGQEFEEMDETFSVDEAFGSAAGNCQSYNKFIDSRRGVFTIGHFYENTLGIRLDEHIMKRGGIRSVFTEQTWLQVTEDKFATAVNGMVFRDDVGIFTGIRNELLDYYPERVWMLRLAEKLHDFAQYGQSNYARMMARQDYVTANLCIAQGMKSAMEIVYLLNRTYAPYYKWMRKGMENLCVLKGLVPLLDELAMTRCQKDAWTALGDTAVADTGDESMSSASDVHAARISPRYSPYKVNHDDQAVCLFEQMAVLILEELKLQGIVSGNETFMDVHCQTLIGRAMNPGRTENEDLDDRSGMENQRNEVGQEKRKEKIKMDIQNMSRDEWIDKIVHLEWAQFDKVKNEGGRADCQDDWNTFSIMRKSQYMAWNDELLASYCNDLQDADARGWNMIMEKYARMMKSTAPERYAELEKDLPERSEERNAIAEEIIKIQVAWMEDFASKYPKMAGNARSIHTSEDSAYNTSYETYLRGELGTYSEETFVLYGRFIVELNKNGENLAYNIMNNTAKLYGYADVEDAEKRLD